MKPLSKPLSPIPLDTYRAARNIFNLEHIYILIGDRLETILEDINLPVLDFSSCLDHQTIFRLAFVTAFQYAENIPDPQVSDTILHRMDWKYALHLPANHPGISSPVLCQFRQNIQSSPKALAEFGRLLENLREAGLFAVGIRQSLVPGEVLRTVCQVNRLHHINQAMKNALGALVSTAPEWVRSNALPHWYERYKSQSTDPHDHSMDWVGEAEILGHDVSRLISALQNNGIPGLDANPEVQQLSKLWEEQYVLEDRGIRIRTPQCEFCSCYRP